MTAQLIVFPMADVAHGYATARDVLDNPIATRAEISAAVDVLSYSRDPSDLIRVREGRIMLWATRDSDLTPNLAERFAAMHQRQVSQRNSRILRKAVIWVACALLGITVAMAAGLIATKAMANAAHGHVFRTEFPHE